MHHQGSSFSCARACHSASKILGIILLLDGAISSSGQIHCTSFATQTWYNCPQFPPPNDVEGLKKIRDAGGYYFRLEPPRRTGKVRFTAPTSTYLDLLSVVDAAK